MLARMLERYDTWLARMAERDELEVDHVDTDCFHPSGVWCTCAYDDYAGQSEVRP